MIFRILSDLHIEFSNYVIQTNDADKDKILILAGDIQVFKKQKQYSEMLIELSVKFKHIIVVPGNHEYYKSRIIGGSRKLRDAIDGLNITILEKETIVIDDVAIIGATLWSDFGCSQTVLDNAQEEMNDYKHIRHGPPGIPWKRKLTAVDTLGFHNVHKEYIFNEVAKHKANNLKTVVITHHAPSLKSQDARYVGNDINRAYVSDLDDMIIDNGPMLWVHGHVHETFDYLVGDTNVRCNPRGYPRKDGSHENAQFNEFSEVEV